MKFHEDKHVNLFVWILVLCLLAVLALWSIEKSVPAVTVKFIANVLFALLRLSLIALLIALIAFKTKSEYKG